MSTITTENITRLLADAVRDWNEALEGDSGDAEIEAGVQLADLVGAICDDILAGRILVATPKPLGEGKIYSLRAGWITGKGEGGLSFELDHNAGLGGASLMLTVTLPNGDVVRENLDVKDLVTGWVSAIADRATNTKE